MQMYHSWFWLQRPSEGYEQQIMLACWLKVTFCPGEMQALGVSKDTRSWSKQGWFSCKGSSIWCRKCSSLLCHTALVWLGAVMELQSLGLGKSPWGHKVHLSAQRQDQLYLRQGLSNCSQKTFNDPGSKTSRQSISMINSSLSSGRVVGFSLLLSSLNLFYSLSLLLLSYALWAWKYCFLHKVIKHLKNASEPPLSSSVSSMQTG